MKNLVIFLCLLLHTLVCVRTMAQETYKVIKVSPKDQVTINKKVIVAGDALKSDANVQLKTQGTKMFLRTPQCFYTVTQKGTLKQVLGKCTATDGSGTKRGLINSLQELRDLLNMRKLLVIDTMQLSIPVRVFKIKNYYNGLQSGFMFLTIQSKDCSNGECLVPVQAGKDNSFLLHEGIFKVGKGTIDRKTIQKMELKYAESADTVVSIATLDLIFIKGQDLRDEVKTLLDSVKNLPAEKQAEQVQTYLSLAYEVAVDFPLLREWLAKEFGL